MGGSSTEEFPLLSALGLYAADIRGDGNCLFNALSDQLYGTQDQHSNIRSRVIDYMRDHAEYYKQFIDVHPGGGIRRNPKRKNAGAFSTPVNTAAPSEADIDRVFESHLQSMAKGGTYGDNMEITAFSSAFDYDVKIYQRDFAYMVSSGNDGVRPVAHIAYHIWEHYSSIRNLDGPHTGLPDVTPKVLSTEEEQRQKEKLAQTPHVLPWQIDVVSKSLPYIADKPTIKRALEAARGDVNLAVSNLLDAEEYGSGSSHQESSSVERDHDSDDDILDAPNKKQDRRMSKASRLLNERPEVNRSTLSQIAQHGSQESFASYNSEASSTLESSQQSTITQPTSIDDYDTRMSKKGDSQASNSQPSTATATPPIRIRLLPPRPPDQSQRSGKMQQKQNDTRVSARDKKYLKKKAQKMNRKESHQAAAHTDRPPSPSKVGIALRAKGMTETPPVETLRTLYI